MKRKLIYTFAALALAAVLPAEATWTYVASPGKYNGNNDKAFSGVVTDSQTWTFYILDLGDGTWQLGAGTWGVDQNFGSFLAGKSDSKTPIPYDGSNYTGTGSGVLDLSTLTKDTGLSFSAVGPRFMGGHTGVTSIILPPGVKSIGIAAFQGCTALTSFDARLTSLETIADATNAGSPFYRGVLQNCTALTDIYLPDTVETIGTYAFTWLKENATVAIHMPGPVPTSIASTAFGGKTTQWALCVNALQYRDWYNSYADWKYTVDENMAGVNWPDPKSGNENSGWIPAQVRYDSTDYPAPFGYANTSAKGVLSLARLYLIQEGEAGETIPASSSVVVSDIGRTNATFTVTVDLGTSSEATLTFTVGEHTETATASAGTTTFTYTYYDLDLGTTYNYSAAVTADSGNGSTTGEMATVGPDVELGATDYLQPNDGLSATLTVNVAQLLSGTVAIVLSRDGTDIETKTVSEAGDVAFDVSGLTLWQTYDYTFTATSSEHGDVATTTLSFKAQPYHWEYTPNDGETQAYPWDGTPPQAGVQKGFINNQPYHGTLTDGRWVFCVYHNPEWKADEFWLGEGNSGSTAYSQKGLPDIDLSGVYDDTGIKLVGIGGYAFAQKSADITSIVFPKFITHIGKQAFYNCGNLKDIDLGHTLLTNVLEMGLQNCTSLTNIVFPATLETLGGTALAWGPDKRAIHFLGDVPVCEPSVSSGTKGSDQAIYSGANNRQWAYCVDAEKYPRWKTDATTTLYTTENPFPAATEATWMAEHVRKGQPYANGKKTYGYPFGNSTLGRSYDTSTNGRAYLIQETQITQSFSIIIR